MSALRVRRCALSFPHGDQRGVPLLQGRPSLMGRRGRSARRSLVVPDFVLSDYGHPPADLPGPGAFRLVGCLTEHRCVEPGNQPVERLLAAEQGPCSSVSPDNGKGALVEGPPVGGIHVHHVSPHPASDQAVPARLPGIEVSVLSPPHPELYADFGGPPSVFGQSPSSMCLTATLASGKGPRRHRSPPSRHIGRSDAASCPRSAGRTSPPASRHGTWLPRTRWSCAKRAGAEAVPARQTLFPAHVAELPHQGVAAPGNRRLAFQGTRGSREGVPCDDVSGGIGIGAGIGWKDSIFRNRRPVASPQGTTTGQHSSHGKDSSPSPMDGWA